MLVSKNAKTCVTPNANAKICIIPTAKPQQESAEYIGSVGSPGVGAGVGHVHFFFFVDFIRIKSRFSVEYGLNDTYKVLSKLDIQLN